MIKVLVYGSRYWADPRPIWEYLGSSKVLTGRGAWRVTLQGGGIVLFECWDMDDDGEVKTYLQAGSVNGVAPHAHPKPESKGE